MDANLDPRVRREIEAYKFALIDNRKAVHENQGYTVLTEGYLKGRFAQDCTKIIKKM